MATRTVISHDGDVLDAIIWRNLGNCNDSLLLTVYGLNPGLCEAGAVLPAGREVILPAEIPAEDSNVDTGFKLWD